MQKDIANTITWLSKLFKKFFSNAPWATSIVIIMSLLSQLSSIVALLLPLKVIMLLGSATVPNFVPPPLNTLDRNTLILSLGMLSFIFYAIMILTNKISVHASQVGVKKLLTKSHKFVLFENQDEIASNAYLKFAEGISGLTFSIFGMVIILSVYNDVGITILASFSLFIVIIPVISHHLPLLKKIITDKAQKFIRNLSDVTFLVVFSFILVDFLYFTPPSFIAAVFTIILTRITLSRLTVSIIDMVFLQKQATRINILFLNAKTTTDSQKKPKNDIWNFAVPEDRHSWVTQLVKQLVTNDGNDLSRDKISIELHPSGVKNILVFIVEIKDTKQKFLFKLFDKPQTMAALHEATLLTEVTDQLPTPALILVTTLSGFHCHIFDISDCELIKPKQFLEAKKQLQQKLLSINLADDFIAHYLHSKRMLWHELTPDMFTRLKLFVTDKQLNEIETIEQGTTSVIDALQMLPLRLDTDINDQLLLENNDGMLLLADWHKWQLIPLSVGVVSNDLSVTQLSTYCQASDGVISGNKDVLKNAIELALLTKKLVANVKKQNYNIIFDEISPKLAERITYHQTILTEQAMHQTEASN